ncbi:LmeA family phospholipid-binding protein [Leptolyngbya sp. AN02str]|uniref:LmeA family phospholipid-binding protein n=1 Tax=Leptolyngbya sp. AN02str TaxID=3423363 RepID=UPI003D31F4D9
MFGVLNNFKSSLNADLGEQMLNAVASQSIRHLFTSCEAVEVDIQCHPSSKLLQGSIDSFKMSGRNLVIRRDFEVEEMSFATDAVSIDPGSVLAGQIKLRQPTQAVAQVMLTEAAINKAFESPLVTQHLVNVKAEAVTNLSGGEPVSFRDIRVKLLPENQIQLQAVTDLPNRKDVPISLVATLTVERRKRISFKDPRFEGAEVPADMTGLSEVLTMAFAEILDNMVDFDRFDLDGVMLRVNRLETHGQKLVFSGYAQIEHFPKQ